MRALLIFGKRFGSDNAPLIELGRKITGLGHSVTFAHWDDETIIKEYLSFEILIGHSFGGARALEVIHPLTQITYLGLIDPVDPAWFPFGLSHYWKKFQIPSNVQKADCFTRAFNLIPPAGTVYGTNSLLAVNHTGIASSHAEMPAHPFVVDTILSSIKLL